MSFRLRTMIVVFTMIDVALSLLTERSRRRQAAIDAIGMAGGLVRSEFGFREFEEKGYRLFIPGYDRRDIQRSWSERVLGDSQRSVFFPAGRVPRVAVEATATLHELRFLHARNTSLNDSDLALVRELPRLESLDLTNCPITDRTAGVLGNFRELRSLELTDTQIGDETAAELAKLKNLEVLRIRGTRITDRGIAQICELTDLKELDYGSSEKNRSPITAVGSAEIERRLTNRDVYKNRNRDDAQWEVPQEEVPAPGP